MGGSHAAAADALLPYSSRRLRMTRAAGTLRCSYERVHRALREGIRHPCQRFCPANVPTRSSTTARVANACRSMPRTAFMQGLRHQGSVRDHQLDQPPEGGSGPNYQSL